MNFHDKNNSPTFLINTKIFTIHTAKLIQMPDIVTNIMLPIFLWVPEVYAFVVQRKNSLIFEVSNRWRKEEEKICAKHYTHSRVIRKNVLQ